MPEVIKALVLGIIQGLTEFIPVSSSAHLALTPWYLGWLEPTATYQLFFDLVLHWGTLLAVTVVFWRDFIALIAAWFQSIGRRSMADSNARLAWFIIVGTIPAVVVGYFFKDQIEAFFHPAGDTGNVTARWVGFFMLVTAGLLAGSELLAKRLQQVRELPQMNWLDSILIGLAQAFALLPGISRSGSTIAMGLARGIRRDQAARYSFLLGTPAILGAGLLQLADIAGEDTGQIAGNLLPLTVGFLAAAVTGIIAIRFLLKYLRNHSLYIFSVYCLVVGLVTIVVSFVR